MGVFADMAVSGLSFWQQYLEPEDTPQDPPDPSMTMQSLVVVVSGALATARHSEPTRDFMSAAGLASLSSEKLSASSEQTEYSIQQKPAA